MSATNRGAERVDSDFYPTPHWCTVGLIRWLRAHGYPVTGVFDPCAGEGHILRAALSVDPGLALSARELRPECETGLRSFVGHVEIGDALAIPAPSLKMSALITNPPFSLTARFLDHYRDCAPIDCWLLAVNKLARAKWWAAQSPAHVVVMEQRPKFVAVCQGITKTKTRARVKGCGRSYPIGTGGKCACGGSIADASDAAEYAWFIRARNPRPGVPALGWLDLHAERPVVAVKARRGNGQADLFGGAP